MPHAEKKPKPTFRKTLSPAKEATAIELKQESPNVRYLKVRPFFREDKANWLTASFRKVPQLQLCGDWLQAAGFSPNAYVSVTVMNGLLIIRSAEN